MQPDHLAGWLRGPGRGQFFGCRPRWRRFVLDRLDGFFQLGSRQLDNTSAGQALERYLGPCARNLPEKAAAGVLLFHPQDFTGLERIQVKTPWHGKSSSPYRLSGGDA
jgi:hypothetical protein